MKVIETTLVPIVCPDFQLTVREQKVLALAVFAEQFFSRTGELDW
jgi:hypothetical protein